MAYVPLADSDKLVQDGVMSGGTLYRYGSEARARLTEIDYENIKLYAELA